MSFLNKLFTLRIVGTILFIQVSVINLTGQDLPYDSTYRPARYDEIVQQFKSYPNDTSDIVFFGNSITARTDWSELLQLDDAVNRGISGDITYGLLERLDEVTEGHPAKIFILIGINDISRNIPDSLILANYKKIITGIKRESPDTEVYVETLLPVNSEFGKYKNHYNKDEHILFVNEKLKEMTKAEHVTLIDIYPHFLDEQKRFDEKYTFDGLHPNAAGYEILKKVLKSGGYLKN